MHDYVSSYPPLKELNERRAEIERRRHELQQRFLAEEARFELERRGYHAAVHAGDVDATPPRPAKDVSEVARSLMNETLAIDHAKRELVRRDEAKLVAKFDQREAEILSDPALAEAVATITKASAAVREVIAGRQEVWGFATPGAERVAASYPSEPIDVLAAVLAGVSRLPVKDERLTVYM